MKMNQNMLVSGFGSGDGKSVDSIWIVKEIQAMMHGFGDSTKPLLSSAKLIEEVMVKQLRSAVIQAEEVAEHRQSSVIQPEDFVFLMRKDRVKLQRLVKYLSIKDMKEKGFGKLSSMSDALLNDGFEAVSPLKKRTQDIIAFITALDPTFTPSFDVPDPVKHERNVRADKISSSLKAEQYAEYVNSRRASFCNTPTKVDLLYKRLFSQEIGKPEEPNLSVACYDILGYLGYETVAQIMDFTLHVRQDAYSKVGDPVSRYIPPSLTFPYTLSKNSQMEGAGPLSVAEIREALRRYWSPQFSPFKSENHIHSRLLAI